MVWNDAILPETTQVPRGGATCSKRAWESAVGRDMAAKKRHFKSEMIHIKILTIPEHPFTADTHLMYKKKINKTTSNHVGLPVGHNNVNHNFTILCIRSQCWSY